MLRRFYNSLRYRIQKLLSIDPVSGVRVSPGFHLERIGTEYGGWVIPVGRLHKGSICYCVGTGEDISFDIGLLEKYECEVFAFDPTPRAVKYIQDHYANLPHYHFSNIGLWDSTATLKFYAPANSEHVSHSVVNLQQTTDYFEAECRRLSSITRENGHARLDLLKIDVEGAEYKVIDSILEDGIDIDILCIEYHELPNSAGFRSSISDSLHKLLRKGYKLGAVDGRNYTLVLTTSTDR